MSTEQTPFATYPTFHPPQNQKPSQPQIIYVPQIVCQPQEVFSQIPQPLIAQSPDVNIQGDAQSDENVQVVHENKLIQEASIQDKHNLAFKATRLLLITILVSLIFDFPFYFYLVMFISSIIDSFKNFEKVRKGGSFVTFTIIFAFVLQGAFPSRFIKYYSSYEYDYFTLMTICALGQAFVTLAGILYFIKTEKKELNLQESTFWIVISNLLYTIILFAFNLYEVFVIISFITLIVIGFYYIFVLKTFLFKGFKDLKTNEYMIASIIVFGKMFVPSLNQNN